MKFSPSPWRWDNLRGWSPQRIAAARRAILKEQSRVDSLREEVALFPDMQAEIQPDFTSVEERQDAMDRREIHITREFRVARARNWRAARLLLRKLHPHRRRGAILLWNQNNLPKDPAYFSEFLRGYQNPGCSPWTYLRKTHLCRLWAHGIRPKPDNFLAITTSFQTLGPVPHLRLRDQNLLSIARLRGVSLREIRQFYRAEHSAIYLKQTFLTDSTEHDHQ